MWRTRREGGLSKSPFHRLSSGNWNPMNDRWSGEKERANSGNCSSFLTHIHIPPPPLPPPPIIFLFHLQLLPLPLQFIQPPPIPITCHRLLNFQFSIHLHLPPYVTVPPFHCLFLFFPLLSSNSTANYLIPSSPLSPPLPQPSLPTNS